jgi:hypothetical protein
MPPVTFPQPNAEQKAAAFFAPHIAHGAVPETLKGLILNVACEYCDEYWWLDNGSALGVPQQSPSARKSNSYFDSDKY